MAMAAIANPCALSPTAALASQKLATPPFVSPLRPSSSSSYPSLTFHKLHLLIKPRLQIIPRRLEVSPLRAELSAVADPETDLKDGEAGSESAVATVAAPTKPKTGKAALLLKRDRVDLLLYTRFFSLFACPLGVCMNRCKLCGISCRRQGPNVFWRYRN